MFLQFRFAARRWQPGSAVVFAALCRRCEKNDIPCYSNDLTSCIRICMFKSLLFFCLIVSYSTESPAAAKDRMVMPNFTPKVTWSTKGTSIYDVCHNYGYGHWKYRRCRMAAVKEFKTRCKDAKKKIRNTQGKRQKAARNDKAKFCKTFRP